MGPGARRLTAIVSALALATGVTAAAIGAASGDARTISFYHIHTNETLTVLYKKDGQYIPEALAKINWIMRDWRKNEAIAIDPETIDIIWEMHTEFGSREPVQIICGYRARDTNEMLRKTVGGQASQSQHITGKAVDVAFPDVPLRQMRYSALVRERGGVGYYPTSGIPFVHVDTGRVRHWPRMPRDELALLFPSGHSKHEPAEGGPITPDDVRAARERNKDLTQQVAAYFEVRDRPKAPILVADAGDLGSLPPPRPTPAARPPKALDNRMSVGAPVAAPEEEQRVAAPSLVDEPRLIERPSQFTARAASSDRSRLDMLVTLASLEVPVSPGPVAQTASITRQDEPPAKPQAKAAPPRALAGASLSGIFPSPSGSPKPAKARAETKVAALDPGVFDPRVPDPRVPDPSVPAGRPGSAADDGGPGWRTAWAQAPAYDDEHPEELSYRPFPLAPLLTTSPSPDDPALAVLVHPDAARTLELLDDDGSVLPMRLRPRQQTAELLWAQEFRGQAVSLSELEAAEPPRPAPTGLAKKSVMTLPR